MNGTRTLRGARAMVVLAWATAALLAGGVAWWGVAAIGDDAGVARGGVLTESDVRAELAQQRAAATASPSPSATSDPTRTPTPTLTSTTEPTPSADPDPDPSPTEPPTEPAVQEVVRTWDVLGGHVAAACRGATISLLYATPLDGWTVEVEDSGPENVKVELHRDASELTVRAACTEGIPTMQTETGDATGGGESEDN